MTDIHPDCAACRSSLESWAPETVGEADRRAVADHVAGCDACRRAAVAADPAFLFVTLRGGPLPGQFWQGFDEGLRSRIASEAARPAPARVAARLAALVRGMKDAITWAPSPAIGAAAMVLLLGVTVAILRPDAFGPGAHPPQVEGLRSPYAPPGAPVRPAGPPRSREPLTVPPIALLPGAGDPPALEEVASPSARVYRFDAADGHAAPIYFVVDESIEF